MTAVEERDVARKAVEGVLGAGFEEADLAPVKGKERE